MDDDDLNDFVVPSEDSKKAKRQLFRPKNQEPKSKKPKVEDKSDLQDFELKKGPQFKSPAYLPTGDFRLHPKWTSSLSPLLKFLANKKIEVIFEK